MFGQDLGLRGYVMSFAVYVVLVMLMPVRYLFGLTGAGHCVVGVFFIPMHPGWGIIAISCGIVLIVLRVRTIICVRPKPLRKRAAQ